MVASRTMMVLKKISMIALVTAFIFIIGVPTKSFAAGSVPYTFKSVVTGGGGGFIPGIIFNPTQKDLIYARTDIGGAYRWDPSSKGWIPLLDSVGWVDWNKNGVDALATDPVDPNRLYVAVGTYTNVYDSNNGYILRSTDKGTTWQATQLPFKVGGNMPGRSMGERLMIDPNANNILYFGARSGNGLWKSTDYGVTWTKVTSFPDVGTYIQSPGQEYGSDLIGLDWITFDPRTGSSGNPTQTIYVGVADNTGDSIYRSTDGGATWSAVPGQPHAGFMPHHGVLSSTGNLYITYNNGVGPYDGSKGDLWKYNTNTGVWTNISPVPSTDSSQTWGYGGLAVDAQHPDTIVVATLNQWWPDANIYRSTDGGATWTSFWSWNGYPNRTLRYTQDISAAPWLTFGNAPNPPIPSPLIGWMIGDLEIDPFNSGRMMYGTGATLYGTNNLTTMDTGGTVNLSVMAKGIEEMAVLGLISPPSGAHLLSAVGDDTGFKYDDLTQAPSMMFTNPNYSTSTSIDYAELNPSFIVRVGNVDKSTDANAKALGISTDGGTTWNPDATEPAGSSGGNAAAGADGNTIVWSPSTTGVYYTTDSGNTWTASSGVPTGAKVISDRVNPSKFYAWSAGKFYVSTDRGATFTQTATTALPANNVTQYPGSSMDIKAMPGHEGDIWVAGGSTTEGKYGIWHSTDSGSSFTQLSNVQEADAIGFGKAQPGRSYMALYANAKVNGVRGFFRSDDAGTTWTRINDDQHQYARVTTITGDPRIYGRVYIGTNGRGVIYGDPVSGVNTSLIYKIINENSGKVLDVSNSSTADGANVQQWTSWSPGTNQQWDFVDAGGGYYKIMNVNSGKVLDVAGMSTADGANVQQYTSWSPGANQQWQMVDNGNGTYKIVNKNSGKVLDVASASTSDGGNVVQSTDNGAADQQWQLVAVDTP
ncbi:RICIN domain-containing protein [Paenibacillus sp. sptzw28]|uniref:RICIN domain-containing protein n=1 Tax=Paenibacillus sp. sptzw28 TaxID=715179 RepID=UPI001C6F0232|nr:RICIN domain-containing protein [Paenibacillus sp. sptzw28]QYR20333.1 RICIN domain-containing protein [Paenibacillus sp. sptzw28]